MARILILGDTHGDAPTHIEAIEAAADAGAQHIFQVGDCGLFPRWFDTIEGIELVNDSARKYGIKCNWVRGNHDDPDAWQAITDHFPTKHRGWGRLRSHINLLPRVSYFKMFGQQFLAVGGAVSVDKANRLSDEKKSGPKTQWWPNEAISGDDLRAVDETKVDILLTHDCSNKTTFGSRVKPDPDSEQNRMKVDKILSRSRADFHFHGHMHEKYDWGNYMVHGMNHETRTIGLECNKNRWLPFPNNWVIFDTETKQIDWKLP